MHLKGNCSKEAAQLLAEFHQYNLETLADASAEARSERERQWAATLARIDELAAANSNGRIFIATIEEALAECWRLPVVIAPASPADPPAASSAGEGLAAPIEDLAAEAPAEWPAILLQCDEGQYTVSVETAYGWIEVIRDQGPHVWHTAEPSSIAELVQRAAELAGAPDAEALAPQTEPATSTTSAGRQ